MKLEQKTADFKKLIGSSLAPVDELLYNLLYDNASSPRAATIISLACFIQGIPASLQEVILNEPQSTVSSAPGLMGI